MLPRHNEYFTKLSLNIPMKSPWEAAYTECNNKLLPRNEFVQVQQCAGRRGPSGPLSHIYSGWDVRSGHPQRICRTALKAFHLLRQKRLNPGNLARLRRPCQAKPEYQSQALGVTRRRCFAQNSTGQTLGEFVIGLIVQKRQRL